MREWVIAACSLKIGRLSIRDPRRVRNATSISEAIPFLEYDLHRLLVYKLRVAGLNAAFNCRFQLEVGENLMVAVCTARSRGLL